MRYRVLTLSAADVDAACRRLESLCGGLRPDLVVGIAEGGVEIARRIFPQVDHCIVGSGYSHSHSHMKGRWLSRLPRWLLDRLRIIEVSMRRKKTSGSLPAFSGVVLNKIADAKRVLIVDDAVDSGSTLRALSDAIKRAAPEAEVRSAVLTVTGRNPLVIPDFWVFPKGTLLRFPWSLDARK